MSLGYPKRAAFTLIEIMVVMAIMAIALAVAIPNLRDIQRSPIAQATKDFLEAARKARNDAVMLGRPMQLVILADRDQTRLLIEPAPLGVLGATNGVSNAGLEARESATWDGSKLAGSYTLPSEVAFRKLVVNGRDYIAISDATAIRFYPNGTADQSVSEMQWLRKEARQFTVEVMTGYVDVQEVP